MIRKLLLAALIAVPICYYFALIVGAATYPGYSHVTRYASELGAADAPYPALFNVPIIIGGVAAVFASIGVVAALRDLSGGWLWAGLAGVALACWGASMVLGGMFPMPDERHGGFGLGLAGPLVPLFALLAIRKVEDAKGMRLFLGFIFVGSVIVLAIMFGVGHLVTRRNVGIWQRINTAISIRGSRCLEFGCSNAMRIFGARLVSHLRITDHAKTVAWQAGYDRCGGVRRGELRWKSGWYPDQALGTSACTLSTCK